MESFGTAVIDTACTRTVCGERWFDNFVEENKNKKIYKSDSHRAFKFGDGQKIYSFKRAIIPATIGETPCNIDTEIVKADIPLLLSKNSLKKAGTVLDLKNDQAVMFEQPIMLQLTSSGHYCVDITGRDNFIPEETEQEVLVIEGDLSETEKWRILKKLHKQFGHASAERLTKLLKSAGTTDRSTLAMLQNITHDCEICAKLKKPTPRPVVGLPLATEYNETIAVDLHELENGRVWYLHIIDEFTRFSAGCIVRTKCSSEFVKKFMEIWICVHGAPKRLYSDNGREFNSNEVRDMCENFNIENKTTPGYSPWSNGLLERHNMVLTEILLKVKEENSCDWSTALHWSLMAKNSLNNVHGYSPYQLVFGCTPNLPSVLVDKPPALEGTTISQTVGEHIIALHAARTAFTQSECSERIRRALRKQTRNCGEHFDMRDKVFYKRPDSQEWKGPGVVIGQDGAVVFIRHGGTLVRVHRCRLSKVHPKVETNSDNLENRLQEKHVQSSTTETEKWEDDKGGHCDDSSEEENTGNTQDAEAEDHVEQRNVSLRKGQIVRYKNTDTGVECVVEILGRAGKSTGANKNWYNVKYAEPDEMAGAKISVDLSKVTDLQCVEQEQEDEDVLILQDVSFTEAKSAELESWYRNRVYVEVHDIGQKCVSTRWVCTLKETSEGSVRKARLVARGFEETVIRDIPKDSPTCGTESLRLFVSVLAQENWQLHTMDIKTAFLQGSELTRQVFIRPPPEAKSKGKVWQLRKCVYGLADASLHWYQKVKEVLEQCGCETSKMDPAVFYWKDTNGTVSGILACHVDDFVWGGTHKFEHTVIDTIRKTFKVGSEHDLEGEAFQYVGIELTRTESGIQLSQNNYLQNISPIDLSGARKQNRQSDVTETERDKLRSKLGQILWVARQSRPDVLFDTSTLTGKLKHAKVQDIVQTNKVIKQLKSEKLKLTFTNLGASHLLKLIREWIVFAAGMAI